MSFESVRFSKSYEDNRKKKRTFSNNITFEIHKILTVFRKVFAHDLKKVPQSKIIYLFSSSKEIVSARSWFVI